MIPKFGALALCTFHEPHGLLVTTQPCDVEAGALVHREVQPAHERVQRQHVLNQLHLHEHCTYGVKPVNKQNSSADC